MTETDRGRPPAQSGNGTLMARRSRVMVDAFLQPMFDRLSGTPGHVVGGGVGDWQNVCAGCDVLRPDAARVSGVHIDVPR